MEIYFGMWYTNISYALKSRAMGAVKGKSMRVKQKSRAVLHGVLLTLIILALTALLIGGAMYYSYTKVDETDVPAFAVTLNDAPLTPDSLQWHTPVFGGLSYKSYTREDAAARQNLGAYDETVFTIKMPDNVKAHVLVRDPQGNTIIESDGSAKFAVEENGTFRYEITLTAEQRQGEAYGQYHYAGSFEVAVAPKITFSETSVRQGDIVTVLVSGIMDDSVPSITDTVSYTRFAKRGTSYSAEIGVGYNVSPGSYDVTVTCGDLTATQTITVNTGEFGRQDMTIDTSVTDSTMNVPGAAQQWRENIIALYDTADEEIYWQGVFERPVTCEIINTEYGLYRYTNGSSSYDRHAGIDFDSDEGDPVTAPNNGRVVFAGFLAYTGNTVVIEHGAGLKSYIFHMSELHCAQGDMVKTGDLIGAVGSTGYSTGPHMHYEVRVGQHAVNPLPLLDGTSGLYLAD